MKGLEEAEKSTLSQLQSLSNQTSTLVYYVKVIHAQYTNGFRDVLLLDFTEKVQN